MSTKYVPSLNGLRALSILFVITGHLAYRNFHGADLPGPQMGVNIFFIISGFLITLLLLEEEKINGSINLKKFYLRRTLRIFPAYYFLLFSYLILQLAGILQFHTNSWITSLTYTKYFRVTHSHEWETDHLWSLSVEEHFYLMWPLIFKFLRPYRVKIALLIILLVPIIRGVNYAQGMEKINSGATLLLRADALMIGCLLAIYRESISGWITKVIEKYKFMIFLPLFGLAFSLVIMKIIPADSVVIGGATRALARATGTFTNVFVCLIILISANFKNTLWYRFLNTGAMNYAGKLSYSLYLWQQLFFSDHIGILGKFPVNIFCIVVAAMISYYFIEKPFLRLKSRFEVQKDTVRLISQQVGFAESKMN
jgi:peptidoglycan/LPS O-acetylase OafA/YrhL